MVRTTPKSDFVEMFCSITELVEDTFLDTDSVELSSQLHNLFDTIDAIEVALSAPDFLCEYSMMV